MEIKKPQNGKFFRWKFAVCSWQLEVVQLAVAMFNGQWLARVRLESYACVRYYYFEKTNQGIAQLCSEGKGIH